MKAVVSSTYDSKYLFFLPIITWCWNKLGVDVICFMPAFGREAGWMQKIALVNKVIRITNPEWKCHLFDAPEHKEATYAQCSRLYAAALDLPEDEMIIVGDVDMSVFRIPPNYDGRMTVVGVDLVPKGQIPMCYISGPVKEWRKAFAINGRSAQSCLDDLLGGIESITMRGDYWAKDQEEAYERLIVAQPRVIEVPRARPGTQFASNRLDRDDAYLLERLSLDIIDFHMPRPGFEENNFNQILTVLKYFYPNDNFDWLKQFREQYISLL